MAGGMETDAFRVFNLYDEDGDGYITQTEMVRYLGVSLRAAGGVMDVDGAVREATDKAFRFADRNHDGVLSFDEFKRWYLENGNGANGNFGNTTTHTNNRNSMTNRNSGFEGSSNTFEIRIPKASYCFEDGFYCDSFGNKTNKKRAKAVNSVDPLVKSYYKNVFVAYELQLSEKGQTWSVYKRYSSLYTFVKEVRAKLPVGTSVNATFPPKVLAKVNIEERRVGLEWYLRVFLRDSKIREMDIVRIFLRSTDAEPFDGTSQLGMANVSSNGVTNSPSLTANMLQTLDSTNAVGGGGNPLINSSPNPQVMSHNNPSTPMMNNNQTPYISNGYGVNLEGASSYGEEQSVFTDDMSYQSKGQNFPTNNRHMNHQNAGLGFGGFSSQENHSQLPSMDEDMRHLSPAERLDGLGVSLPLALPGCLSQLDSDQASTVTITVKVAAVANTINSGSGWELERAVGLQVLSQLQLATRRNLGIVTIISVSPSGNFNTRMTQQNGGGGHGNSGGYGMEGGRLSNRFNDQNPSNHSYHQNNGGGAGAGSAESFLAPTRALLREVLGGHGSAVGHGKSAQELRMFFESADVDNNGNLSADELLNVLANLGLPTDKSMVQAMMDIADTDGDGCLDYDEFVQFLSVDRSEEADLRLAFTRFDQDGDGKISASDLKAALAIQGQEVNQDEVWRIIQKVTQGSDEAIYYKHFKQLLRPNNNDENSSSLFNTMNTSSSNSGEASVIVVAHLALDEEMILQDDFEKKLCSSGVRLRKCGRMVGGVLKGGGYRTFKLDVLHHQPHLLVWKKGGLKSGLKGKFDLRQVTDVVCGANNSIRGISALQIHLLSPSGTLSLEAKSPEEHRTLLDGFRRLRSRVRTSPHLLTNQNSKTFNSTENSKSTSKSTNRIQNTYLSAASQESDLVQAFQHEDRSQSGFLDAISIGKVLTSKHLKLSSDEIQSIMNRVNRRGNSYDYRELAIHVVSLSDPSLHAKQATERALLDLLRAADSHNSGVLSAVVLGQALTSLGTVGGGTVISDDLVNFAAKLSEIPNGTVDYVKFARIAAGLDERASSQYLIYKKQKSNEIAVEISNRYLSERCLMVYSVISRHANPDDATGAGSISPVNLGVALSELGGLSPQEVTALLQRVPTHRKGGDLKWKEARVVDELGKMLVLDDEQRWKRSFDRWDKNHDGSLTLRELERALTATSGVERAREEVERIVRSADLDLDGSLSLSEFFVIMKIAELDQ